MASGDIVSGISDPNTDISLQPAAGVQLMITWIGMDNTTNAYSYLTDGTIQSNSTSTSGRAFLSTMNLKQFITNAMYFKIGGIGGTSRSSYTGIQIK